jgi:hypothetical protein
VAGRMDGDDGLQVAAKWVEELAVARG